jgi:NADH:ubiquinone oxidoreductase subunit
MDRGQAYTLEGIVAAMLVLISVLLALQAVSLTPTTPGTIDRDTRSQLRGQAVDVLTAAHENESLTEAVLEWDVENSEFHDPYPVYNVTKRYGYGPKDPPNEFGAMLNQTFGQRGYAFNVYVEYRDDEDWTETRRRVLVWRGIPTDNAVSASYVLTLYDHMRLTSPGNQERLEALRSDDFYASDLAPNRPLFNVVRVRVVVW